METTRIQNPHAEDFSLPRLESLLDKIFESHDEPWVASEPETILSALKDAGHEVTPRLAAKVKILLYIREDGVVDLLSDPLRVLYSSEVLNNEDSVFYDPDFIPHVTAMELAYFVSQIDRFLKPTDELPYEFKKVCAYILADEGFYEAPPSIPFVSKEDIFFDHLDAIPETDKEIQASKNKGVETYLKLLSAL